MKILNETPRAMPGESHFIFLIVHFQKKVRCYLFIFCPNEETSERIDIRSDRNNTGLH